MWIKATVRRHVSYFNIYMFIFESAFNFTHEILIISLFILYAIILMERIRDYLSTIKQNYEIEFLFF